MRTVVLHHIVAGGKYPGERFCFPLGQGSSGLCNVSSFQGRKPGLADGHHSAEADAAQVSEDCALSRQTPLCAARALRMRGTEVVSMMVLLHQGHGNGQWQDHSVMLHHVSILIASK
jgi:hypothetical protein